MKKLKAVDIDVEIIKEYVWSCECGHYNRDSDLNPVLICQGCQEPFEVEGDVNEH